jgi:hypothetical protein
MAREDMPALSLMPVLRLHDLIEQLVAAERVVGHKALVQIGERACELAMRVEPGPSRDIEDKGKS